jgi:lipopolysaccharide transport system permease protein
MTLQQYWTQVRALTVASLKSRYRKTWAGFLWVIMSPVLLFGVQSLVFKQFLRLSVPNYFLFLLGGLLPWIFVTSTVQMGTPIFVSQGQLFRSFKINHWVVLGAQVMDSFVNFLASFFIIMIPFYLSSGKPLWILGALPVAFIPLLLGTLGLTICLSVLNVFYRDINFVMGFVFGLLYFLTPIFYPIEFVPQEYLWIVDLNPIYHLINPFRTLISQSELQGTLPIFLKSYGVAFGSIIVAYLIWKKKQNDFYRNL